VSSCTAAQEWAESSLASGRAEDFRTSVQHETFASCPVDDDSASESKLDAVKRAAKCLHKLDYDISHLITKLSVLSTADMSTRARAKSTAMLLQDFCNTTAVVANVCEVERFPEQTEPTMAGCSTNTAGSARSALAEFLERDSSVRDSDFVEDSDREHSSATEWMSSSSLRGAPREFISREFSGANILVPGPGQSRADGEATGGSVERLGVVEGTTIRVLSGTNGRGVPTGGCAVSHLSDTAERDARGVSELESSYFSKLANSEETNRPLIGASRLPYLTYWMHARAV
jgi:hypothetical protein